MGIYLYVGPQLSRSFSLKQFKLAWPPEAWWASSEKVRGQRSDASRDQTSAVAKFQSTLDQSKNFFSILLSTRNPFRSKLTWKKSQQQQQQQQ